jgi:mRNA-degrading endonuclease toxin of MazEF toxin-antitoxin module
MVKNFPGWHALKQSIDSLTGARPMGYKDRDVWWLSVGHNVGFEENGKGPAFRRPVLVVRGFSKEVFWGVPLTSKIKSGIYYHTFTITGATTQSTALLSQLRTFDTKRMISKVGMVNEADFKEIKKQLRAFIK